MTIKGWRVRSRDEFYSCSAWPHWYLGWCCGRYGFGIVRETWGWRVTVWDIDFCYHDSKPENNE